MSNRNLKKAIISYPPTSLDNTNELGIVVSSSEYVSSSGKRSCCCWLVWLGWARQPSRLVTTCCC